MNRFSGCLAVLLTIFLFSRIQAQQDQVPNIMVEAEYKGPHEIGVGATKSIPPHIFYKTDGYNFDIKVLIITQNNSSFIDSAYGIVCILPDYSVRSIYLDHKSILRISEFTYQYSFRQKVKSGGWMKVFLVSRIEMQSDTDVNVYRMTSNKERIFLDTR